MIHTLQPEVSADNGRMLRILPIMVSCNNNVFNMRLTLQCISLLRQNEGEKHIKVFLERSTVGPFADVMRRNVTLMEPHYAERRFSFHTGCWIRQPRCIYSKHNVRVYRFLSMSLVCIHDLGQIWSNRESSSVEMKVAAALTDGRTRLVALNI